MANDFFIATGKDAMVDALMDNLDHLGSGNETDRIAAQLNRDLIAVFDKWVGQQIDLRRNPANVCEAGLSGYITVIGTVLLNLDHINEDLRSELFQRIKSETNKKLIETYGFIKEKR